MIKADSNRKHERGVHVTLSNRFISNYDQYLYFFAVSTIARTFSMLVSRVSSHPPERMNLPLRPAFSIHSIDSLLTSAGVPSIMRL